MCMDYGNAVIIDFWFLIFGGLQVGQKVYVVTSHSHEAGWWYGASEGKHGLFPAVCVEATYQTQEVRN